MGTGRTSKKISWQPFEVNFDFSISFNSMSRLGLCPNIQSVWSSVCEWKALFKLTLHNYYIIKDSLTISLGDKKLEKTKITI
jgi:hypothetical protein